MPERFAGSKKRVTFFVCCVFNHWREWHPFNLVIRETQVLLGTGAHSFTYRHGRKEGSRRLRLEPSK